LPGPILLGSQDGFSVEWDTPPGFTAGYLEIKEKFVYRFSLLQRFSIPMVTLFHDGQLCKLGLPFIGRQRIRTTPGGGEIRLFVPEGTRRVKVLITFPGILNARPERVELRNVTFYRFLFKPLIPYTRTFEKQGC